VVRRAPRTPAGDIGDTGPVHAGHAAPVDDGDDAGWASGPLDEPLESAVECPVRVAGRSGLRRGSGGDREPERGQDEQSSQYAISQ
jgi:hypothetical protein